MKYEIAALALSWNEKDILKDTVRRLKNEPIEIWVVDNGSTDGTQEWLKTQSGINVIQLKENIGAGPARNKVIENFKADYLLMLDGDIMYIPESAFGLREELEELPEDAYCLGIHTYRRWDGTPNREESTQRWNGAGNIRDTVSIAWTQYGLFKGDLIRKNKFPDKGVFYGPGYGYEDDWVNALMEKDGHKAYYCDKPLYYHHAHKTTRSKIKTNQDARRKALYKNFPGYVHWMDRPEAYDDMV